MSIRKRRRDRTRNRIANQKLKAQLTKVLNNLLAMRSKEIDAPASSEQHWCDAIEGILELIPDYKTLNTEFQYYLKNIELNQALLRGKISVENANHAADYWGLILNVQVPKTNPSSISQTKKD